MRGEQSRFELPSCFGLATGNHYSSHGTVKELETFVYIIKDGNSHSLSSIAETTLFVEIFKSAHLQNFLSFSHYYF